MQYRYDLHLHSCLSPCGDEDMTPYNLVHMAKLLELDIIALTDHNTVGNCKSAMKVGEEVGVVVVPGMELCTAEEIHMVCLFPDLPSAEAFEAEVRPGLPPVKNKAEVYGRQLYMDEGDGVLGEEEILLVTASAIPVGQAGALCEKHGGFCYPAHIDRASYSVLAAFGMITEDMGFTCAEVTAKADLEALTTANPCLARMKLLRSSDAHYLENMSEAADVIFLPRCTASALLEALRGIALTK